jgi:flavin reductase (DIM6/NTAB) family NADH-FMN oxidoreductase RutF
MGSETYTSADWDLWDKQFRRYFMNAISGPKPLFLMGTKHASGVSNLGLFSNLLHVGAHPPTLAVLFRPLTVARHSYHNLMEQKQATLNLVSESMLSKAHLCSASFPEEVSEFQEAGFAEEYSASWEAPAVKESPLQLGVVPVEEHCLEVNNTVLVVLKVEWVRLKGVSAERDGFLDLNKLEAVSANGLDAYAGLKQVSKFLYAKPGRPAEVVDSFIP